MSLKISPIAHGKHNNIWFNVKNKSLSMKIVGFYDSGYAYVQKTSIKNNKLNKELNYNNIKNKLEDCFDFILKTKQETALKNGIKFNTTNDLLKSI